MSDGASTMRATRLAAVAALIGALLGAALPGVFMLTATDRQADSETSRSLSEFLRLQRQAAYAKFYADAKDFGEAVAARDLQRLEKPEDDCPMRLDLNRRRDELLSDLANVQLVGSEEAREAASDVAGSFAAFPILMLCTVDGSERFLPQVEIVREDRPVDAIDAFLQAARRDLSST